MASITIRSLEPTIKARLRIRAASHGHSMEEEARNILRGALAEDAEAPVNLAKAIRALVKPFGGVDLEIPPREPAREPPKFR
jgi:plasmid stability protein